MIKRFVNFSYRNFDLVVRQLKDPSKQVDRRRSGAAPVEPDRYNEYLWCQNGPNYSKESFDAQTWLGWSDRI